MFFFNKIRKNNTIRAFVKKCSGKINFNKRVTINDKVFIIPIINNIGFGNIFLNEGHWIINLIQIFNKINSGNFIDIGANIGQTLLQVRSCLEKTSYIGFEPNPACVGYVKHLIKKNNLNDCLIIPVGISSENKLLNLFALSEVDSGATMVGSLRPEYNYTERYIVPVFDFSSIIKNLEIKNIGIIKIDVEGAELEVIKSISPFLEIFKPLIICEILWSHNLDCIEEKKNRNKQLFSILKDNNYVVFQIIKSDSLNSVEYFKEILEFDNQVYSDDNSHLCDYLFIHFDHCKQLSEITNVQKLN